MKKSTEELLLMKKSTEEILAEIDDLKIRNRVMGLALKIYRVNLRAWNHNYYLFRSASVPTLRLKALFAAQGAQIGMSLALRVLNKVSKEGE